MNSPDVHLLEEIEYWQSEADRLYTVMRWLRGIVSSIQEANSDPLTALLCIHALKIVDDNS